MWRRSCAATKRRWKAWTTRDHNFFQPVMRVQEKIVVADTDRRTRVKRRYDQAKTPFDHLCATNAISPERRTQVTALRDQTNPRQLLAEIRALIDYTFSLPGAVPCETEDVYQTLNLPVFEQSADGASVTLSFDLTR